MIGVGLWIFLSICAILKRERIWFGVKYMGQRITAWVKKELILVLAFVCAAVSCLFVPPSRAYLDYIDWSVLGLLFCLMAVVAGLSASGLFNRMAQVLLSGQKSIRLLCMSLWVKILCFSISFYLSVTSQL